MTGNSQARERRLASYLLLPRPKDLIKAWIFPAAFGVGVAASGGADADQVTRALVVWAVLELLIYQARYQWNDIRGFHADQRHPDARSRGRLPGPRSRARAHIAASAAVATARLAGAAIVVALFPGLDLLAPVAGLAVAVFAVAVVYEALKSRGATVALWLVVGCGYAVRGVGGLALGIALAGRPVLAASAAICLWAFGVAFVTIRWALEALPFARVGARGELSWHAEPEQARDHTLALARWLPARIPADGTGRAGALEDWRPLAGPTSLAAPWNLATILAALCGGIAGALLGGEEGLGPVALVAVVALALALAVLAAPRNRGRRWALGVVALVGLAAVLSAPRPLLVALPWALVTGSHLLFSAQSLRTLGHPIRGALASLAGGAPGQRRTGPARTAAGARSAGAPGR